MNPGVFSVKNNRTVFVAMLLAVIGGYVAYNRLGRLEDPEFTIKQALIVTPYPGASAEEVAALQAEYDTISGQRSTLFKGETLRGLLLSTYAWSTVGNIAGIAAIVAFVAAGLMLVLVVLGVVHFARTPKA